MAKALIIYGSTTGNTETMAAMVEKAIREAGVEATTREAGDASTSDLTGDNDLVILGCPAYGDHEVELQEDFADFYEAWGGLKLNGEKFAVFAPGDSSYEYFCGSVDFLEEQIEAAGGTIVVPGLKIDGDPGDAEGEIASWSASLAKSL